MALDAIRRLRNAQTKDRQVVFESGVPDADILDRHFLVPKSKDLQKAASAWMALSFFLAYAALPFGAELTGLFPGLLAGFWAGAKGYAFITAAIVLGIHWGKPKVRIPRGEGSIPSDPFVMATAGSLITWAVLHNVLVGLTPFSMMTGGELLSLGFINVVESGMIGLMLGSFVRGRVKAFALAAAFQAVLTGLFLYFV
ncbi:MAG: hypothetical protein GY913_10045 [Proteobacteria bacterium]|nr:hypothetical protein [Pseudomonadota bacterium]MCP4917254.1 hypothetical protein [Pseudomonadota bacterium]